MNIPESLQKKINKAIIDAAEEIEDTVTGAIRAAARKDIAAMLGIDARWEGWTLVNNANPTPLQKQIIASVTARAKVIADQIGEVALTLTDMKRIEKAYREEYKDQLLNAVVEIARTKAAERALADAEAMFSATLTVEGGHE